MVSAALPRQRMLDAALALASEGGYDALQVRAIAQRASVSSRTIYEHFPSLESLLIIAVAERAGELLYRRFTENVPRKRTQAARVVKLIEELNEVMTTNRMLTLALLRALMCGKPDVAPHVRNFSALTEAVIANAIAPGGPTASDKEAARILERVWFSALIGWATGSDPDGHIIATMRKAAPRVLQSD
jgi:TetR/AcrR family transcriptional regulator, cholesterol catabolism regulator